MSNTNNISASQYKLARLFLDVFGDKDILLEATWPWLLSDKKRPMYVDIYVPSLNLCVEYQGMQHYIYPNRYHKSYDEFIRQRERDKQKKELILKHGLNYLVWLWNEPISRKRLWEKLKVIGILPKDKQ